MTDLASKLYPAMAQETAPASPSREIPPAEPAHAREDNSAASPAHTPAREEDDLEPLTPAEKLHSFDGSPPSDGAYDFAVAPVFDELGRMALGEGQADAMPAIAEGRQQVATVMAELGVGGPGAKELAGIFGRYWREPVEDPTAQGERTESQLRALWGSEYSINLTRARRAFDAAAERIPWLREEAKNGAGNDLRVIQHFAAVGRRMALKAKR